MENNKNSFDVDTLHQQPIGSGFTAASTAEDVIAGIDLKGKTAIVTGGYSGLGRETARVLSAAGAHVIVPARDLEKAQSALKGIDVEIWAMDLLDPASIDAFVIHFLAAERPLHILVNSAGIMACPLARDARGYESQFATNHLGHFQLTAGLWPALIKAKGARIVSVSSWGHRFSPVVFEDPNFLNREYDRWLGYGQSKTANVLFAVGLDERGRHDNIRAFSLHPGAISGTGLEKHIPEQELIDAGVLDLNGNAIRDPSKGLKTVEQGSSTTVWCATSPKLDGIGGVYCEDTEVAAIEQAVTSDGFVIGDSLKRIGVMAYAIDRNNANKLWALSEELTGIKF